MRPKKRLVDNTDLTTVMNEILKSLNLNDRINPLLNDYIHRHQIVDVSDIKTAKAKMASGIRKPGMSWGTFKLILLSIINPKTVTITFDIVSRGGRKSQIVFPIDNDKITTGESKK